MLATIGLSTALWNSRYWLAGVHAFFLLLLCLAFVGSALAFTHLGASLSQDQLAYDQCRKEYIDQPDVCAARYPDVVSPEARHSHFLKIIKNCSYIPFSLFAILVALALFLSEQTPLETTRSAPAEGVRGHEWKERLDALCIAAGVFVPELYIIEHESINAALWGKTAKESRLYITRGACQNLPPDELDALLAQQLGHLINGDHVIYPFMSMFVNLGCSLALFCSAPSLYVVVSLPPTLWVTAPGVFLAVVLLFFPLSWFIFRTYGKEFGQTRQFMADLFAIRLSKDALALVRLIDRTKNQKEMYVFTEEQRQLAFINPDPASTLPWHANPDERIMALREAIGMAAFAGNKARTPKLRKKK